MGKAVRAPRMIQTMRWFGPRDPVTLDFIRMAGASGVVTSLHEIPDGEVWGVEEIRRRKELIERHGLRWCVVESVPVHDDIKVQAGDCGKYIENFCTTIRNLGSCGIPTVCYNFMTLLDWMRTDLVFPYSDGSLALAFDWRDLAVFDIYISKRSGAEEEYAQLFPGGLDDYFKSLPQSKIETIKKNVLKGLPGTDGFYTIEDFGQLSKKFGSISPGQMRANLVAFLEKVIPVAEEANICMAIHPDDPPFSLFGVPRVVSTEQDLVSILKAVNSRANGFTLCTGSYGVNPENNLVRMVHQNGDRLHFIHLRNIKRDGTGSFVESGHLEGDVNMRDVVASILKVMNSRGEEIPMRSDHGHLMLHEMVNHEGIYPGYGVIGRMRGLSELRGLELALVNGA